MFQYSLALRDQRVNPLRLSTRRHSLESKTNLLGNCFVCVDSIIHRRSRSHRSRFAGVRCVVELSTRVKFLHTLIFRSFSRLDKEKLIFFSSSSRSINVYSFSLSSRLCTLFDILCALYNIKIEPRGFFDEKFVTSQNDRLDDKLDESDLVALRKSNEI